MEINRDDKYKLIIDNIREYLVFVNDGCRMRWNTEDLNKLLFRELTIDEFMEYEKFGLGVPRMMYDPLLADDELRKIDLRNIDFTNIDVRFKDFSGMNVVIDPEVVYDNSLEGIRIEISSIYDKSVNKGRVKKINNKSYK